MWGVYSLLWETLHVYQAYKKQKHTKKVVRTSVIFIFYYSLNILN